MGAPVRNVAGGMAVLEAESEFSGWDLSLGFGCFGIHPKERTEEAGAALAETAARPKL